MGPCPPPGPTGLTTTWRLQRREGGRGEALILEVQRRPVIRGWEKSEMAGGDPKSSILSSLQESSVTVPCCI
ncbi:hypothetical protein VULLAG_LOCUS1927 [Vulpes lagopus]